MNWTPSLSTLPLVTVTSPLLIVFDAGAVMLVYYQNVYGNLEATGAGEKINEKRQF